MSQPLTLAPTLARSNQSVQVQFTVRNDTKSSVTLRWLKVAVRDPGGANVDYRATADLTLQPGQEYNYRSTRVLGSVGTYTLWPAANRDGTWTELTAPSTYTVQYDTGPDSSEVGSPCSDQRGVFGPGQFPDACWRPFAANSPFNKPLPTAPRLAPNSSAIVSRVLGDLSPQDQPNNLIANLDGASGEPTYYARPTDPEFTLSCTMKQWGTCSLEGLKIRIPAGAQVEGGHAALPTNSDAYMQQPDAHLTVIDLATGWEYDLWQVHRSPIRPEDGATLSFSWGGRARIDGDGMEADVDGQGTAAQFASLAGRVRVEELLAGRIDHALFVDIPCDSGAYVYPARATGGRCTNPVDAPPMGARFWLDMSAEEIDALPIPAWKKTLLYAMARYGMFSGDTGVEGYFAIEAEAGNQYLSVGLADKWLDFAIANGWSYYPGGADYPYPNFTGRFGDDDDGLDWTASVWSRLRIIDPCVSVGTC